KSGQSICYQTGQIYLLPTQTFAGAACVTGPASWQARVACKPLRADTAGGIAVDDDICLPAERQQEY
ncbi:MAG TPA: hypothetical protein PK359_16035, partial [Burkholderiaceae bacterium]|nr:hypothetical protein [Burkholderiaceae bacterium]